jgi:ligand-binding sensor domain-containing protein/signal transduction histidine kinase
MRAKIVFLLHIGVFLAFSTRAQIQFLRISNKDGLQSGNVRCLRQDHQGFFWIGTEDGLYRFDGSEFVAYRHIKGDSTSLSTNYIFSIYEDSRQNLWIGTMDGGLLYYNREKDCFHRIGVNKDNRKAIIGNSITAITEVEPNMIVLSTEEGIFNYFSITGSPLEQPDIFQIKEPSLSGPLIERTHTGFTTSAVDRQGNLWVYYYNYGVIQIDLKTNALVGKPIEFEGELQSLYIDSKNRMWIGTWHDGLYVVDLATAKRTQFVNDGRATSLLHNFIAMVKEDHDGNMWIGTDEGVNILQAEYDPFDRPPLISLQHDDEDEATILSNPVKTIFVDIDGRVWIGSIYGGVSIYDKHAPAFHAIKRHPSLPGLIHNNVTAFQTDDEGNLWIGSDAGGVNIVRGGISNIFQPTFEKVTLINTFTHNEERKIKCIEKDGLGNMWIGTWGGGIFKVRTKDMSIQHFNKADKRRPLPSNEITSLQADRGNNIWAGTFGAGLFKLDEGNYTVDPMPGLRMANPRQFQKINVIFEGLDGKMWIAKESGGFGYVDETEHRFVNIVDSLLTVDLTITSVQQDSAGVFWLGTNTIGILRHDPATKRTENFDDHYGLINPMAHSIVMDDAGKLWIATNSGISTFDYESKKFTNYTKGAAIVGNLYNNSSFAKGNDGTILFGGNNGIVVFNPDNIKPYRPTPGFAFTGFAVHNIPLSAKAGSLPQNIILIDSIELKHDQNAISIQFRSIDFNFAADRKYAFKLEGFNDDWQGIGNDQKAVFTNLPPGEYRFKVRSTTDGSSWAEAPKSIYLRIRPAWWQTLLFKVSLFAGIAGLAFVSVRLRISFLKERQQYLERIVKVRTHELNDKNHELGRMVQEISHQNKELFETRLEIAKMNHEIQTQNGELKAQNDHILQQREELELAQERLKASNDDLEKLVEERTKKLKTTIRQLDKTVFELDRFVYSASHDLSAPLKSILGLLHLARNERDIDKLNEYHQYIEMSIHKLEMVIRSLVEYSRNAHMELSVEHTNIRNLVQEVIGELFFLPESSYLKFHNNVDPRLEILTDHYRLKIVLQNIINNAIKYSDPSKPESAVTINCQPEKGDNVRLDISDNGIGIEAENLSKIFSMYFRATERSKGSGLGLFIVKETVQKLQGNILVTSEKWKGTTFTLVFPRTVKVKERVAEHKH